MKWSKQHARQKAGGRHKPRCFGNDVSALVTEAQVWQAELTGGEAISHHQKKKKKKLYMRKPGSECGGKIDTTWSPPQLSAALQVEGSLSWWWCHCLETPRCTPRLLVSSPEQFRFHGFQHSTSAGIRGKTSKPLSNIKPCFLRVNYLGIFITVTKRSTGVTP